jgi:hypothetical protein
MALLGYCSELLIGWFLLANLWPWQVRIEHIEQAIMMPDELPASMGGLFMKASALIPLIFFVSAGSAHAGYRPGPTEPPATHFRGPCDSDPDGKKFAEKACFTTYDPGHVGFHSRYKPPVCDKSTPVTEQQKDILARIYARAPDYMKAKLCRLTQMFVVGSYKDAKSPTPPQEDWESFGFWEGSDRPPGTGVYLGIAARDLASKQSFADAENRTVDALLGFVDSPKRDRPPPLPGLRSDSAPDPELALLGKFAHELGHAILADTNADGTDRRHPRRKVSGPPSSKCFEEAILAASWNTKIFHHHMRRWVGFGDQNHNRTKNPDIAPSFERLRAAVRSRKFGVASDAIENIYRSKEFVNVLAVGGGPEEDLVQTYTYKVMADASKNQPLVFPLKGGDINVIDLLGSGVPAKKVECLGELGFLTAQP